MLDLKLDVSGSGLKEGSPSPISSLNSSSVPNLRISSSSCLDMEPVLEPRPGRTTRWVSIIFFFATWWRQFVEDQQAVSRWSLNYNSAGAILRSVYNLLCVYWVFLFTDLCDPLLHWGFCNKAIDHHLPVLANTVSSAERLQHTRNKQHNLLLSK